MTLRNAIDDAIRAAMRNAEYIELAGDVGDPEVADPYSRVQSALEDGLARVKALRNHAHEWDSDSRCIHCGADGLA